MHATERARGLDWRLTIFFVSAGSPDYDPRTLYIPKKAWDKFTPFETQVRHIAKFASKPRKEYGT